VPKEDITLDIEADSLKPDVIHCVVLGIKGQPLEVFTNPEEFNSFLKEHEGSSLYAHNGLGYDYPVLERLWGADLSKVSLMDTLVMSRLDNPSRLGGHSLESWGERLGFPKGDYAGGWDTYTPEMLEYCKQDVRVTQRVLKVLRDEGNMADAPLALEQDTAVIINKQMEAGWRFDIKGAYVLLGTLKERSLDLREEVREVFVPLPVAIKTVTPKIKKDGTLSVVGLKFLGEQLATVGGAFTRVDYPEFSLSSRQQIARHLKYYGWVPKVFTKKSMEKSKLLRDKTLLTPQVDEVVLEGVKGIPQVTLISEYLMLEKRRAMVEKWIGAYDSESGRIYGYVDPCGAVTGRMTHSGPNLAQVPASGSSYGVECRSLFIVKEGYKLVGADASGLELRMLAHYMNDPQYIKDLLEGDIHTVNMKAAGLSNRDQAKTFIYAFLYGAGDAKIGSIVGGSRNQGRILKGKFLENTPALAELKKIGPNHRGLVEGLDGRMLHCRSQHSALNLLLQSAGAIVMKKALVILYNYAILWGIDYEFVGNIHDEFQMEVREDQADKLGYLAVECIKAAGIQLGLKCPLDGEYKVGNNWAETH